jgi:hypothetical protein
VLSVPRPATTSRTKPTQMRSSPAATVAGAAGASVPDVELPAAPVAVADTQTGVAPNGIDVRARLVAAAHGVRPVQPPGTKFVPPETEDSTPS